MSTPSPSPSTPLPRVTLNTLLSFARGDSSSIISKNKSSDAMRDDERLKNVRMIDDVEDDERQPTFFYNPVTYSWQKERYTDTHHRPIEYHQYARDVQYKNKRRARRGDWRNNVPIRIGKGMSVEDDEVFNLQTWNTMGSAPGPRMPKGLDTKRHFRPLIPSLDALYGERED